MFPSTAQDKKEVTAPTGLLKATTKKKKKYRKKAKKVKVDDSAQKGNKVTEPTVAKAAEEPVQEPASMWGGAWSALASLIPFGGAVPEDEETPGGPEEQQKEQETTPANGQQDS